MLMVAPDQGKIVLLTWMFSEAPDPAFPLILSLYQNDYTPVNGSTAGDFDVADFDGSDPLEIDPSAFDTPVIVSHVAQTTYPDTPEWTCTGGGPQTVYGWYLTTPDGTTVLLAQRFDSPRVMDTGSTESLDPYTISLKTFS